VPQAQHMSKQIRFSNNQYDKFQQQGRPAKAENQLVFEINNNYAQTYAGPPSQPTVYYQQQQQQLIVPPQLNQHQVLGTLHQYGMYQVASPIVQCPLYNLGLCPWNGQQTQLSSHMNECLQNHFNHICIQPQQTPCANRAQQIVVTIKDMIEYLMLRYYTQIDIVNHLRTMATERVILAGKLKLSLTKQQVWNRMQLDNPHFFAAYEKRLMLRYQMDTYNRLNQELIISMGYSEETIDDTIQNFQNYQIQFDALLDSKNVTNDRQPFG
jgi:hypothetical protein